MFKAFSYLESLASLRQPPVETDPVHAQRLDYATQLASASLSHFLPGLPRERHPEVIRDIRLNMRWAALDERSLFRDAGTETLDFLLESTEVVDPEGVLERAARGEPFLFCTFHSGSYRLVNVVLGSAGVSFSLVIAQDTLNTQGEEYLQVYESFKARTASRIQMDLLNAEASNIGLQAMRRIRGGRSLLFYIDGNTGVGGALRRDDKLVPVRLLGRTLYARKGIAFLSHATRAPIVPVVCERTGWLSRRITFHPALSPSADAERESFCREATQAIYAVLEPLLERAPEQWGGWLEVHRFLDLEALGEAAPPPGAAGAPAADDLLVLDAERYALLRLSGAAVLFDRAAFRAIPLSAPLQAAISTFSAPARADAPSPSGAPVDAELVRALFGRGILVRHAPAPVPAAVRQPAA